MWRIIGLLLLFLAAVPAYSKDLPQTPRIEAKEQTKNSPPANENPDHNSHTIAAPPPIQLQQAPDIDAKKASKDTQNRSDEASEYWTFAGRRVKVTDTLLVLFTALLFGATVLLYFATKNLVTGAEGTARHELRAYMGVEHINIQDEFRGGPPGFGKLAIRNFGKTMAKETQITIVGALVTVGDKTDFPLGERKSKTVVMPHESLGFEELIDKRPQDIGLLDKGVGTIYVWGRIDYTDVFGEPHWTTFRFESYKRFLTTDITGWNVKTCDEGNDAT